MNINLKCSHLLKKEADYIGGVFRGIDAINRRLTVECNADPRLSRDNGFQLCMLWVAPANYASIEGSSNSSLIVQWSDNIDDAQCPNDLLTYMEE